MEREGRQCLQGTSKTSTDSVPVVPSTVVDNDDDHQSCGSTDEVCAIAVATSLDTETRDPPVHDMLHLITHQLTLTNYCSLPQSRPVLSTMIIHRLSRNSVIRHQTNFIYFKSLN